MGWVDRRALPVAAVALCLWIWPCVLQAADNIPVAQPVFGARKIFVLLFLMLGPIKILVPFVDMTKDADISFRRRLATRAILFSAAALTVAGVIGRSRRADDVICLGRRTFDIIGGSGRAGDIVRGRRRAGEII